jgi:hypothetical protein
MKNKNEDEIDDDSNEAAEFILENISDELCEKLSHQDILTLLKLEDKYIEKREEENKKRKPFLSFDLNILDQDDINYYVMTNAVKHNILLNEEEIEEIMYAEIDYMEGIGQIKDSSIHLN